MEHTVTTKVDFDQLDTADDGSGCILLNGNLFFGIAYEHDEKSGILIGLAGYFFGAAHGASRDWHANGKLATEIYHKTGSRHGPWREWYETGAPKVHSYWECDLCLWKTRWDEHGNLVEDYRLASESKYARKIEERLREGNWRIIDIDVETMEFFERPQGWGKDLPPEAEPG